MTNFGKDYADEVLNDSGRDSEDMLDQVNREDLDQVINQEDFDADDEYYNEVEDLGYPEFADQIDDDYEDMAFDFFDKEDE